MTPATIPQAEANLTLFEAETVLLALTEIDVEALAPEVRAQYEGILIEAVRTSVEKRERVAWRLFDLGQRATVKRSAAEAHRKKADELERAAASYETQADGLKNYVLRVMAELPKPKRGVRTLEGTSATFKAKAVVDAVEITDEAEVPLEYKTVTVKMPGATWQRLVSILEPGLMMGELVGLKAELSVLRALVKEALQKTVECPDCEGTGGPVDLTVYGGGANEPCPTCNGDKTVPAHVPGARLLTDRLRLEVS